MLDLANIPMDQFPLAWRLTDRRYRLLPPADLARIEPLDAASARRAFDLTGPWYREQPFTRGYFADVASTPIDGSAGGEAIRRVRKWLYGRGVPFARRVLLSWGEAEAAVTTWKMVVRYWDDLWYPSDDLAVFDESLSWALFLLARGGGLLRLAAGGDVSGPPPAGRR